MKEIQTYPNLTQDFLVLREGELDIDQLEAIACAERVIALQQTKDRFKGLIRGSGRLVGKGLLLSYAALYDVSNGTDYRHNLDKV